MGRFMIVDDSLFQRKSLGKMVSQMGWEGVVEASNGGEAVEMYQRWNPDLVLMDLVMPEMEGLEALERILALDQNAKIIVISSLGSSDLVDKALSLGAKQFLRKPVNTGEAANILRAVLEEV